MRIITIILLIVITLLIPVAMPAPEPEPMPLPPVEELQEKIEILESRIDALKEDSRIAGKVDKNLSNRIATLEGRRSVSGQEGEGADPQ